MDDMTVRIDYQHRWLGNIIEDGYGPDYPNSAAFSPTPATSPSPPSTPPSTRCSRRK